jgi:hypothetical protein
MAINPVIKIRIDRTAAKIGLSMKNGKSPWVGFSGKGSVEGGAGGHGNGFRVNRHPRHKHFL